MAKIQEVKLEIVRPGPPHNQLLSPLTNYMALCGDGSPITFRIGFEHQPFLNRLEHLRYIVPKPNGGCEAVPEGTRNGELNKIGADMEEVLARISSLNAELNRSRSSADRPGDKGFVHLRLVFSGSELSLLPFELAAAPQSFPGEGLHFTLEGSLPIVVTREIRRSRPLPVGWDQYKKPRVLFISAAPGNLSVPTQEHVQALRAALEPWIRWPHDNEDEPSDKTIPLAPLDRTTIEKNRIENVRERLKILVNASLEDIYQACANGEFSHIHILAHGDHRKKAGEDRFGIALCKKGDPHKKVIVDGDQLSAALLARSEDGIGRSEPVMVTLATCDSGQTGSVLVPGGSIAHDLHAAGIPWVFASQFPLKKRGSVRMTEFMYPLILRGDDPRHVLYELRRYMHMTAEDDHDWASLVCYASVPEGFEDQVDAFFVNQTRFAIEVQMDKTDAVAEHRASPEKLKSNETDDAAEFAIDRALEEANRFLDAWKKRLPAGQAMEVRLQRTKCYGIKGSVFKRFGIVYAKRHDHVRAKEMFERAHRAYRRAKREWATDGFSYHWAATQYLCLCAILGRKKDPETLTLSRRFAERDMKGDDVDNETRAWAYGTLAELELLSLWHLDEGQKVQENVLQKVQENVLRYCGQIVELTSQDSFQTISTQRHFQRYADSWYLKDSEERSLAEVAKVAKAAVRELKPKVP